MLSLKSLNDILNCLCDRQKGFEKIVLTPGIPKKIRKVAAEKAVDLQELIKEVESEISNFNSSDSVSVGIDKKDTSEI